LKAFGLHKEHKAYKKCEMGVSTAAQGKREEVVHKKGKKHIKKRTNKRVPTKPLAHPTTDV
jgi:hypothetical protein